MSSQVLSSDAPVSYTSKLVFIPISEKLAVYHAYITLANTQSTEGAPFAPDVVSEYGVALRAELEAWTPEHPVPIRNLLNTGVSLRELTGSDSALPVMGTIQVIDPKFSMSFYARQFTFRQVRTFLAAHSYTAKELYLELAHPAQDTSPKKHSIPPDRQVLVSFGTSDVLLTGNGMPLLWIGSTISVEATGAADQVVAQLTKAQALKAVLRHELSHNERTGEASLSLTLKVNEALREKLLSEAYARIRGPEGILPWKKLATRWLAL